MMGNLGGLQLPYSYIVVEGPLGVGKTSLARLLSERLGGLAVLEQTEDNPFLPLFYKNPKKHCFQTQVFFLLRRYQHGLEISQMDLFRQVVVADYLFEKDRIFAAINLDENEFWLYEQIYSLLKDRMPRPDLVIFLQARTEVLAERIRKRERRYERSISFDYLDAVNQAFNDFFFHYSEAPLLVVNASDVDFINVPEELDGLIREMATVKPGTQYYISLGSGSS